MSHSYEIQCVSWYPNLQEYVASVVDVKRPGQYQERAAEVPASLLKTILEKVGHNANDTIRKLDDLIKKPMPMKAEQPVAASSQSILSQLAAVTLAPAPTPEKSTFPWDNDNTVKPTFDIPVAAGNKDDIMAYFNAVATEVADTQISDLDDFMNQIAKAAALLRSPFPYFFDNDHFQKARMLWNVEYDANLKVTGPLSEAIDKVEAFIRRFQERVQMHTTSPVRIQVLDSHHACFIKSFNHHRACNGERIYLLSVGSEQRALIFNTAGITVLDTQDQNLNDRQAWK